MNKATKPGAPAEKPASTYRYDDARRKNVPPAGLAPHGRLSEARKLRYAYDPHLPPLLRFDPTGRAQYLDELIGRAIGGTLSEEEGAYLRELLGSGAPWLEWAGKREAHEFVVDPVALNIHERVSTQAILSVLRRGDVQRDLFADPRQEYREAVRFYEYDVDWSNRMILGDSLQVMASLAHRENLAGKVQMIYMDPPYGIRFSSNFQPEIGRRDVKDKDADLTREPEMVKAYRDTWTLGIHSYLSYLRDRLILARELLTDSGSIFVQISDENLHRMRCVMDEVFGPANYCGMIVFRKTTGKASELLDATFDVLLWYAKSRNEVRYLQEYEARSPFDDYNLRFAKSPTGEEFRIADPEELTLLTQQGFFAFRPNPLTSQTPSETTTFGYEYQGRSFSPGKRGWSTNIEGMRRLASAERLVAQGNTLSFIRYLNDFSFKPANDIWDDTRQSGFGDPKVYVVQTASRVIERCLLMTTDPGDLILDPTCGSGTTAYVAEQWGRRWITIDTSRVALALARQRLMTATFPHCAVKDDDASDGKANPARGFIYKTVPHITLKSIAQNVALDPIFAKHQQVLDARLGDMNEALVEVTPELRVHLKWKLADKEKREGKRAVTDADRRRWLLPEKEWREWEVPFDTDDEWPLRLKDALVAYRSAWRAKMDEVNDMIAGSAEQEELVDQPEIERTVVRVSGPFTMEAVMPVEQSEDGADPLAFGGEPADNLETFETETGQSGTGNWEPVAGDAVNAEVFVDRMLRLLSADGVRFPDNRIMRFSRLDRIDGGLALQAEGEWANGEGKERRVVVSIGPEHGPITAVQVEDGLREANRRGADDLVFAGFSFDGAAQAAIQDDPHPRVRAHLAHIAPDVQMGALLKTTPSSQLFSVFGLPRAELKAVSEGEWRVEMRGVDIYDPVTNTIHATRADKVAAWFLDADYDGRTFCITQAFFPDRSAWKKLARALRATIDEERFDALTGTTSLAFKAGEYRRVAVKVIDPRGNEVMRVLRVS